MSMNETPTTFTTNNLVDNDDSISTTMMEGDSIPIVDPPTTMADDQLYDVAPPTTVDNANANHTNHSNNDEATAAIATNATANDNEDNANIILTPAAAQDGWIVNPSYNPSYEYSPTNSNYYPTYPTNGSSLARFDSGVFDVSASDDYDDDAEEDDFIGDIGNIIGYDDHNHESSIEEEDGESRSSVLLEEDDEDAPPLRRENHAASYNTNLPQTHRPFTPKQFTPLFNKRTPLLGQIPLSSLPLDALHTTSLYCTPQDWASLSGCSKVHRDIGREIVKKVWRHAGRCVVEIANAWARGEHADARELASLYISKGVPIYPTPHGHSYHTVAWRMGLELDSANENEEGTVVGEAHTGVAVGNVGNRAAAAGGVNASNSTNQEDGSAATDVFYTERYVDKQNQAGNHRHPLFSNNSTYVEEKALFWKQKKGIEVNPPSPPNMFPPPQARGPLFQRRYSSTGRAAAAAQAPPQPAARSPGAAARAELGLLDWPAGGGFRPQGAAGGPWAAANAAGAADASTTPRYTRRSSFSGNTTNNSFNAGTSSNTMLQLGEYLRNTSSPNLASLNQEQNDQNNASAAVPVAPKMTLRIHRHLADQHFFGSAAVNDENGTMSAGKMSMNADFFHPTGQRGRHRDPNPGGNNSPNQIDNWDGYWDGAGWRTHSGGADVADHRLTPTTTTNYATGGTHRELAINDIGDTVDRRPAFRHQNEERPNNNNDPNQRMMDSNYRAAVRAFVSWTLANTDRQRPPTNNPGVARGGRNPLNHSLWGTGAASSSSGGSTSPASDVHLDVYSSNSADLKSDGEEDDKDSAATYKAIAKMRTRCMHYQQRLDTLLTTTNTSTSNTNNTTSKFDTFSYQECLLDFWDDLFPTTAGIHYYNQQSPIPRMSQLHTFLTTPTPKAIGTIQCEIERVKISSKNSSKGSSAKQRVKGRFFPSYEYRLFIRDTKNDVAYPRQLNSSRSMSRYPPRKDAVLLVAKSKSGKNRNVASNGVAGSSSTGTGRGGSGVGGMDFCTPPGLASSANNSSNTSNGYGSSKRGVTNYYMCLPQQRDVDSHYKSANRNNANATLNGGETSGLGVSPLALHSKASVEVGRLQSNFIGTEFQIFVPTAKASNSARNSQAEDDQLLANAESEGEGDNRVYPIDTAVPTAPAGITPRRPSRRGSGLVRLARRASATMSRRGSSSRNGESGTEQQPVDETDTPLRRGSKKVIRRMSWASASNNINSSNANNKRTNRRAIANNSESSFDECNDLYNSTSPSSDPGSGLTMGEVENGAITYTANLLGNRPRIMDVCFPRLMEDGTVCDEWNGERRQENCVAPSTSNTGVGNGSSCSMTVSSMLDRFKSIQQGGLEDNIMEDALGLAPSNNNNDTNHSSGTTINSANDNNNHGLMILQNRPPWWNIELGAFVLNFGGRVKVASVKNFQLCERNDQDHSMQFGRIEGRHAFTMDFQHPLTPMQAFAIAISSLQSKISFG